MAHEIDELSKGRASYASTQREWHGLGELLERGASIEAWQAASGLDYRIRKAFVRYPLGPEANAEVRTMPDKCVLFRSDTGAALGVVSDSYRIVQPAQVLETFREWTEAGGLTLESAGVLFGGRRYFATAKLADAVYVDGQMDKLVPYVLLSSSADGTLATEFRFTLVRTVCNNTLTMALRDKASHKTSHRSVFRPESARAAVEAGHEAFGAYMQSARALADVRMSSAQADAFTVKLLDGAEDVNKARKSFGYQTIMSLFAGGGKGSMLETARGTAWGMLNAVTDYVDHKARTRGENGEENRTASAQWGEGGKLKDKALELLMAG